MVGTAAGLRGWCATLGLALASGLTTAVGADAEPAADYRGPVDAAALAAAAAVDDATPRPRDAGWTGNLARNPGFEEDFVNTHGEGHVLSFKGGWFYNQRDFVPDCWSFVTDAGKKGWRPLPQDRVSPVGPPLGEGIGTPEAGGSVRYWTWNDGQPRSGGRSLKLEPKVAVRQSFTRAVSQHGGGAWGGVENRPMPVTETEKARFDLPWLASVWTRGGGTLALGSQTVTAKPGGGWQKLELVLPADALPAAHQPVTVDLAGPGEFDDLVVQEQLPDSPNLMPNASFESDTDGHPDGWSRQRKYRAIGPTYYIWTDWNHAFRDNHGGVEIDRLVAHGGRQSVRFDVHPGDEKMIESDAIVLDQKEPRVVEVGVFVRADRVNLIDVRAVDQDGEWMPAYRPSQPEMYRADEADGRLFGNGTFGWRYVRKFFTSVTGRPLKAMRVRLCARGFNGHTLDDAGTRPYEMTCGTVWWDDLRVMERTSTAQELQARGLKLPAQPLPGPGRLADADLDFGERFLGENALGYSFTNGGPAGAFSLRLSTTLPGREPVVTTSPEVKLAAGKRGRLAAPYLVDRLAADLERQATLGVELLDAGKPVAAATYAFNTWPVVADIDVSRHYSLPDENPVTMSVNLGIARASLARVAKLELQLVKVADGAVIDTIAVPDLARGFAETLAALPGAGDGKRAINKFDASEFGMPTPEWTVDRTNLLVRKIDLGKLKVWPHDDPVRDTRLVVRGLDRSGRELFRQASDPFGRMQPTPRQEPIRTVRVREDGAVLINDRPRFLFGATHQSFRTYHGFELISRLGLMGHRLTQGKKEGSFEGLRELWDRWNLYALQIKPVSGMNGTEIVTSLTDAQKTALEEFVRAGGMQNVVSINTGGWEATIKLDDAPLVAQHRATNDWIRKTTGRPVAISTSGAFNAWWLPRYPFYDINHAETEMWGPMDFNVIYMPYMRRAGASPAWVYLPQLYDNTPYERYRFETYENIIRGSAGVSMIQGIGDPSFNRGLAGELRRVEAPLNSTDLRRDVTTEPLLSHKATRHGGKTYVVATNAGPVQIGRWNWHTDGAHSGRACHDGDSVNAMWFRPHGIRIHGFRGLPLPEEIRKGDKIVQYVRIDPADKPDWAMVCIRGDGRFAHNAFLGGFDWGKFVSQDGNILMYSELNHSVWHEINWLIDDKIYERAVVLLGQKEAERLRTFDKSGRTKVKQIAYQPEHFHAAGPLPEPGTWHRIEIDAEQFGLVGKLVDGFAFLTQNGGARWDHSVLERDGKVVRVFCEDTVGVDRGLLAKVRVAVPGLKAGARVKPLFESREIVAEEGGFTDDFTGVETYGYEGHAPSGDLFGFILDPDRDLVRMMPSGYGYTYGPTAVHIYEIPE